MVHASNQIPVLAWLAMVGSTAVSEDQCGRRKRLLLAQGAPALPAARVSWEGEPPATPPHPQGRCASGQEARGSRLRPLPTGVGLRRLSGRTPGGHPAPRASGGAPRSPGAGPLASPARPLGAPSAPGHRWSPGGHPAPAAGPRPGARAGLGRPGPARARVAGGAPRGCCPPGVACPGGPAGCSRAAAARAGHRAGGCRGAGRMTSPPPPARGRTPMASARPGQAPRRPRPARQGARRLEARDRVRWGRRGAGGRCRGAGRRAPRSVGLPAGRETGPPGRHRRGGPGARAMGARASARPGERVGQLLSGTRVDRRAGPPGGAPPGGAAAVQRQPVRCSA